MNFVSLEDIRNIVQILFQITASCVAIAGLRSWIIQLKGKTEYEVAKNVIAGAYRIRDEIKRCQNSFMNSGEWAERQPVSGETQEQKKASDSLFAYKKRYKKVIDEIYNLYPAMIEAEILFGEEARQLIDSLIGCCNQLQGAIDIYHHALYRNEPFKNTETYFNIIYSSPSRGDNNFQSNLDASIEEIKAFFSQYMRTKKFTLNPVRSLQKRKSKPN